MASYRDRFFSEGFHASRRSDMIRFDILRDGPLIKNLGDGHDRVIIDSGKSVDQIRLTLGRTEVGNGNPNEGIGLPNQDGGLAVRLQAEDAAGTLIGPVSRFDDEGITFRTASKAVKFDIRDLVTGLPSGLFDVATLGTKGADIFDYSREKHLDVYIHGGLGDDRLIGGAGDDHPVGGVGDDVLIGHAGNDLLVGSLGNDRVRGGAGDDTAVIFLDTDGADTTDLGSGLDTVRVFGPPGQIRLTLTRFEVGDGHATDSGTMANQDAGLAVRIQAEVAGTPGGPVSRYDDEGISFFAGPGSTFDVRDLVSGAESGDRYQVVRLGTKGRDLFDDGASALTHYVNAGMGNDRLTAGVADDHLVGGLGNDRINGGGGSDLLVGGGGADRFVYSGAPGNDTIVDFLSGTDRIDLSAYGIELDDVETSAQGVNALIEVDSNSDGAFDFQILIVNAAPPVAADFIF